MSELEKLKTKLDLTIYNYEEMSLHPFGIHPEIAKHYECKIKNLQNEIDKLIEVNKEG